MEPARVALDRAVREARAQGGDERVAAGVIGAAGAAQVAVDLAGGQHPRKRAGGDGRAAGVDRPALARDRLGQLGGRDHPAEPQRRRQRLRRRAEVDDPLRREPLQRADRRAVVGVLGVVVVLEHEPVAVRRPREQRAAALGRHHGAGRELVRGRDEERVRVEPRVDTSAVAVHGHADDLEAGRADRRPRVVERRVLHGHPSCPAARQHAAGEPQPLRVAAGHDHVLRRRRHAADAHEVGGQLGAQDVVAARIAVVQRRIRDLGERPAQRGRDRAARELERSGAVAVRSSRGGSSRATPGGGVSLRRR